MVAPSNSGATASSALATTLFTFAMITRGLQGDSGFGSDGAAEFSADVAANRADFGQIDTGFDIHAIQHVNNIFGGDIPGSAKSIGTTAETGDGAVNDGDTQFERSKNIGERLPPGVVEVDSEVPDRGVLRDGVDQLLSFERSSGADGVAQRNFIAAHFEEALGESRNNGRWNGSFIRAAEDAGDIAAHFEVVCASSGDDRV